MDDKEIERLNEIRARLSATGDGAATMTRAHADSLFLLRMLEKARAVLAKAHEALTLLQNRRTEYRGWRLGLAVLDDPTGCAAYEEWQAMERALAAARHEFASGPDPGISFGDALDAVRSK